MFLEIILGIITVALIIILIAKNKEKFIGKIPQNEWNYPGSDYESIPYIENSNLIYGKKTNSPLVDKYTVPYNNCEDTCLNSGFDIDSCYNFCKEPCNAFCLNNNLGSTQECSSACY